MTIFRRGAVYLVMFDGDHAYAYDSLTGRRTAEGPARLLLGGDGRDWLPVYESAELPEGLVRGLILKFPDGD